MIQIRKHADRSAHSVPSRRRVVVRAIVSALTVATLGLGLADDASAATAPSLSASPYFGCAPAGYGGEIFLNPVSLNHDGQTMIVGAEVYKSNGSSWIDIGHMFTSNNQTVYYFQNTVIGSLGADEMHAYVGHGYFAIKVFIGVVGTSSTWSTWANLSPLATGYTNSTVYSSQICRM